VRPAHSLPTQEEDWQPDESVRAQQQGLWSPGSPQSQEVSAGPAGQPRAQDEGVRPAERQSAEEQSALQSDGRRDPVAPEGSAGAAAGLPGSAHPSAEAVEAAGGGAATGDGGSVRLSAGGPAAAPLQSSSQRELESEPGASPPSGQQTAAAGSAPGGAWAGDGAGGDSGAGLQASDGQRAASARGAPGPQGRQPAHPPAGGSSYAPLQEGDFGYTAAKLPAVKVPSPDHAAFKAVSCFSACMSSSCQSAVSCLPGTLRTCATHGCAGEGEAAAARSVPGATAGACPGRGWRGRACEPHVWLDHRARRQPQDLPALRGPRFHSERCGAHSRAWSVYSALGVTS